ncbi:MAG: dethiobiotin synthase [Azospirillum brasilense]|nr:MAG: dethiobiotin synthase [Azospirillum brasilense]
MGAYYIAATGTGIGKTFTTCALVHAARARQRSVMAFKPIISGYDVTDEASDTAQLMQALGSRAIDEISPWRFAAPLSPDMAARKEGQQLSLDTLAGWTQQARDAADTVFIETVGGLMVPLNTEHTTRDWMQAVPLPLIMVTGSYLGAISHTLSTLEAARAAGLAVMALLVNESADSTVGLQATRQSIADHARDIPLILAQPRVSSPAEATVIHSLIEHCA